MFCKKCGAELAIDDCFCSACGERCIKSEDAPSVTGNRRSYKTGHWIVMVLPSVFLLVSITLNILQMFLPEKTRTEDAQITGAEIEHSEYTELVEKAIAALSQKWTELYSQDSIGNGYLAIYNTRVIDVEPDAADAVLQEIDRAMEIDYLVEFSLFSDYLSSAPYYHDAAIYDTVIVYQDGTTAVVGNFFRVYSGLSYNYDYSGFVNQITDFGSAYNSVISTPSAPVEVETAENSASDDPYGFTTFEISTYQKLRLYDLLKAHGFTEYEQPYLLGRRSYKYTAEDYKKITELDESYLYAFYTSTTIETLTEACLALGYEDVKDFLLKNGYVNEDGNPDVGVWYKHNKKEIASIMKEALDK